MYFMDVAPPPPQLLGERVAMSNICPLWFIIIIYMFMIKTALWLV